LIVGVATSEENVAMLIDDGRLYREIINRQDDDVVVNNPLDCINRARIKDFMMGLFREGR
jgi:hypothetical protein